MIKYDPMTSDKPPWLDITSHKFTLPRLEPEFNGFRLVQISDIHFGTWIDGDRLERIVSIVNRLNPDAIAITGDFVSDNPDRYAEELVRNLSRLRAKEAIFAVRGNHDYWTDAQGVADIITDSGIIHLSNSIFSLARGRAALHFAGLDCYYEGKDRLDLVLDRIPTNGAAIILVHEPDFADRSAHSGRFDLQISGHSHGGQLVLPGYGPPFRPKFARKYPLGMYSINGMIQYTNRGIGTSHIQLRINCPAEISLFTLGSPT